MKDSQVPDLSLSISLSLSLSLSNIFRNFVGVCDAPNEADRFSRSADGCSKSSEGLPTPETSPLRPPKPPRTEVRQYSWRNFTKKEVCMCIRILKPLKTKEEEENHRKDGEFTASHPNHKKTMMSLFPACNNSEINLFNHVSPHTNTIYTHKTPETRKKEEEVKFKCLGSTNCRNHSDVIVSGVIVASPNSDVILRNVEVNRPIARKRYAPRKQSLVHSKGILKSSLTVSSRTFTKITLLLAIVIGVFRGLLNIRLPERKSTIGTSSEPLITISFRDSLFLSILRESSATIIGINEGLCSCINKGTFLNNNEQLIRRMEVLHNTIIREERGYMFPGYATCELATFAKRTFFGGKTFGYIYIPVRGLLGFPWILF